VESFLRERHAPLLVAVGGELETVQPSSGAFNAWPANLRKKWPWYNSGWDGGSDTMQTVGELVNNRVTHQLKALFVRTNIQKRKRISQIAASDMGASHSKLVNADYRLSDLASIQPERVGP
jgi:hypothetical protein